MGMPVKLDEDTLTCGQVRQWQEEYRSGDLALADLLAIEQHCRRCEHCRLLLQQCEEQSSTSPLSPSPPPPPLYLAAQIKSEAHQRQPAQRAVPRKRLIGSPHFLAACAVVAAGAIAVLAVICHLEASKPRSDAWAPAFVVTSGGGTIMLVDSDNFFRETSPEEMLERLHQGRAALGLSDGDSAADRTNRQPVTPVAVGPAATATEDSPLASTADP
jgi:anti-sigma-K factor RskA